MFVCDILFWPRSKILNFRRCFSEETPWRKFEAVRVFVDTLLRFVGITVFGDCAWKWLGLISVAAQIQFFVFASYTTYYYWHENIITAIQPYTIMTLIVPGSFVLYDVLGPNKYRSNTLIIFAGTNIYKNRRPTTEYDRKSDELATKLIIHVILTTILVLFANTLCIVGPAYAFIMKGEYATPTGVIVPFMDPTTATSFVVNLSIQFTSTFVCVIDIIGLEAMDCCMINSFTAMADLVCLNMRTFSDGLSSGQFTLQQKSELRDIIVRLQDLEHYIKELTDIYYWRTLTLPLLTTWSVSLGMFAQMMNGFPSGYGFAACIYIQFFVLCYMEKEVTRTCEQIETELYKINWDLMPPQYRKMLVVVLNRWQVGCNITIGPLDVLNYETASTTTKKIYFFFMLLRTLVLK